MLKLIFNIVGLLVPVVIFGFIILFWIKETFGWVPERSRKRKQEKADAKQRLDEERRQHEQNEQAYRRHTAAPKYKVLDYIDFASIDELPKDKAFIEELIDKLKNLGDHSRVIMCHLFLAKHLNNPNSYVDCAMELIAASKGDVETEIIIELLEAAKTPESYFVLYQLDDEGATYATAHYLNLALEEGYAPAFEELDKLRKKASNGNAEAAYVLYDVLHRYAASSALVYVAKPHRQAEFTESCFWLMLASELGHESGRELFAHYQKQNDWDDANMYLEVAALAYEAKQMDMFVMMSVDAALRGHVKSLKNVGIALKQGLGVEVNEPLGVLCYGIAKQKLQEVEA